MSKCGLKSALRRAGWNLTSHAAVQGEGGPGEGGPALTGITLSSEARSDIAALSPSEAILVCPFLTVPQSDGILFHD